MATGKQINLSTAIAKTIAKYETALSKSDFEGAKTLSQALETLLHCSYLEDSAPTYSQAITALKSSTPAFSPEVLTPEDLIPFDGSAILSTYAWDDGFAGKENYGQSNYSSGDSDVIGEHPTPETNNCRDFWER